MTLSRALSAFALDLETGAIPDDVLHAAAARVVDTVGVALASSSTNDGCAARSVVLAEPGDGAASVWASGGARRPAAIASFANGMLAHGIDYDDTHTRATLHPGVSVVPTAVAVGEEVGARGRDVLAAVAVGYEVAARLGMLAPGAFQRRGFHPTSVLGIFGATAAAARLMRVPLGQATHAAGLAGSMASGLMEYLADGTDTKQIHPGWAAQGAVRAVQLAGFGATGPESVLEGDKGVFRSHIDADIDAELVLDGLGDAWVGMNVATKPYPACHAVHAPVDCWTIIRNEHGLTDDEVAGVRRFTALVPHWYLQLVGEPLDEKRRPRSVYEARFSLPYAIARMVVDGELTLDSFDARALADADVLAVAAKVDYEVREYETFPAAFPGGLRVELADGRILESHLDHNVGSVGNPITEQRLHAKFLDAARRVSAPAHADQLLASLRSWTEAGVDLSAFTHSMASVDVGTARY